MSGRTSFTPQIDETALRCVAQARILYADTDKMGIVYHASYFRYLELARVEMLRSEGLPYTWMEAEGLALPLTEIGVSFTSPGLYDDRISIHAALSRVTHVRVNFQYRVVVEPGHRAATPNAEAVELLRAETRHCCVRRDSGRPAAMPEALVERLRAIQSLGRASARMPGGPTVAPSEDG
ncbi:acyl-CoA thioesterase [Paraliomyxa miuraensis]|uniref:acyl-CoA thioesterase n=1 Tax=Paraliomyxa miuraensis TaxID=376150 RepID=UPI0022583834|nr:thioesterase family protein [Paraliomyxa miuraensis]MCX4243476.1 acyl-CoA thioesterase [Paraliomyxa miuraensis]